MALRHPGRSLIGCIRSLLSPFVTLPSLGQVKKVGLANEQILYVVIYICFYFLHYFHFNLIECYHRDLSPGERNA